MKKVKFILGSLCVAFAAMIVIPKLITSLSTYMSGKQTTETEPEQEEDWGPVIEVKQDVNKEQADE